MQALPPSSTAMPAPAQSAESYIAQSAPLQSPTAYTQSASADATQTPAGANAASDDWTSALQTAQQSSPPAAQSLSLIHI